MKPEECIFRFQLKNYLTNYVQLKYFNNIKIQLKLETPFE